jgi:hypothetical protein
MTIDAPVTLVEHADDHDGLSPADEARCVQIAQQIDRDLGDRLVEARERDPAAFRAALDQIGDRLLALDRLRRSNRDLYEIKVRELRNDLQLQRDAEQYRAALAEGDVERIDRLEDQLRGRIRVQIAFMIKSRFDYLCSLEEEVEGIHAKLESTGSNFDALVEDRLELLRRPSP